MCAARNPSPWLFCGECTLNPPEFYCGMCHHGALLSPQTKLQLTVHPHLLPCVSCSQRGIRVEVLSFWLAGCDPAHAANGHLQVVRPWLPECNPSLAGVLEAAQQPWCAKLNRHAFCFLLDYWNIWAQIILHTAARILCRLIIHWVALLFLQRIRADWVLWQNRMTRWLLCPGNQFENLSTFFFSR